MEFPKDVIENIDFMNTVFQRAKKKGSKETQHILATTIDLLIEHHILGEILKNYISEEGIKEHINRQKQAFKDQFERHFIGKNLLLP